MSAASPESLTLLSRAAELRATGKTWPAAAAELGWEHEELRKVVAEHGRLYERLASRARAEFRLDASSEAVAALRTLARSSDPDQCRHAATAILRFEAARLRSGAADAGEQLDRLTRPRRRPRPPADEAHPGRAANTSESPEVPVPQDVNGAQKVAHSGAPPAPPAAPRPPAPPAPNAPPPSEAERRRQRLLMRAAVRPPVTGPLQRGEHPVSSWLGDGGALQSSTANRKSTVPEA
jgi:hypothetical protein